jgi:hypothetical protein
MDFYDIQKFKDYIRKDIQVATRYPVRFISIDTMADWVEILSYLRTITKKSFMLSNFCEDEDQAPNLRRLKSKIRKTSESCVIFPLSEYLRIKNELALKTLDDFLHATCEQNNDRKLKIYIPLFRMKDILKQMKSDVRQEDCFLYLHGQTDNDYSLTIVQKHLDIPNLISPIHGFKKYMEFWEQNPYQSIILLTKNAILYKDLVFSDNVNVIITSYQLLLHHYHIPYLLDEEFGNEQNWFGLAEKFKSHTTFEEAVCSQLNTDRYSDELFSQWKHYSSQQKWLLWLLAKAQSLPGYLGEVVNSTTNVDEFEKRIFTGITNHLHLPNFEQMRAERKNLIENMKLFPGDQVLNEISLLSPIDQIRCLTDLTEKEKVRIFLAIKESGISEESSNAVRVSYPAVYYYYAPSIKFNDDSLNDYFTEYRRLKITDSLSQSFLDRVDRFATEGHEKCFEFNSRNKIVEDFYDDGTCVLFIDCLGVEYLPLIRHLFSNSQYDLSYEIGRCNLPSITECNTDFLDGKQCQKLYKLDELKHSREQYPLSIINELEIINEIKETVDKLLNDFSTIIIASDHGSSRMAVKFWSEAETHDSGEHAKREKYGRYCVDATEDYSNINGCIQENDKWIFADYSRFKQSGAPFNEIHGGASLEEMLVPIIRINLQTTSVQTDQQIKLDLLTPKIKLGVAKTANIEFTLGRRMGAVVAVVEGKRIPCKYIENRYQFELPVTDPKVLVFRIESGKLRSGNYTVIIEKSKCIANADFDI